MNAVLAKHRPKGSDGKQMTQEEWAKLWANSSHVLEPLAEALKDMQRSLTKVDPEDFNCPNHYAKMVANGVKHQTLQQVIDILPKGS